MSVVFGGSGDSYVNRTTNLPATSAFTWMAWVMPTTVAAGDRIFFAFGVVTGAFADYELFISTATLAIWNGGSQANGSTVAANVWRHIAITVSGTSGSNVKVYLDGVLNITHTAATITNTTMRYGSNGATEPFVGRMQGIKVFGAALAQADIQQEMWSQLPQRTANLNDWRPFLASGALTDFAGAANSSTTTGTISSADGPPVAWRGRKRRIVYIPAAGGGTPVSASSNSPSESLTAALLTRLSPAESVVAALRSQIAVDESLGRAAASSQSADESLTRAAATKVAPDESLARVVTTELAPGESVGRVAGTIAVPDESLMRAIVTTVSGDENTTRATRSSSALDESLARVAGSVLSPDENLGPQAIAVSASSTSPMEWLGRAARSLSTGAENVSPVLRAIASAAEWITRVIRSVLVPSESRADGIVTIPEYPPGRFTLDDVQPRFLLDELRPRFALDDIQPRFALDDVRPTFTLDDVQPTFTLLEDHPS